MSNQLDPDLLSLLACPCPRHGGLAQVDGASGDALECQLCQTRFPVRDGVPVLLLSEATAGPHGVGGEA